MAESVFLVIHNDRYAQSLTAQLLARRRFEITRPVCWAEVERQFRWWSPGTVLVCEEELWDGKTATDVAALDPTGWPIVRRVLYATDVHCHQAEFPERVQKGEIDKLVQVVRRLARQS